MDNISGFFLYNDIHVTQQVSDIKSFFNDLLNLEKFDTIIELGTSLGGLTYILDDIVKENKLDCSLHTFDISYHDYVEKQLNDRGCTYYILDEQDEIYMKTVIDLINSNNKILLLCDGGNKIEEFNRYSPYLKPGDFIMAHDYSHDLDTFNNEIKNKYWNWFEISYKDIQLSIEKYCLVNYEKKDFKYAAWACYEKK